MTVLCYGTLEVDGIIITLVIVKNRTN